MVNQNPEQRARDQIDKLLTAAGWVVQNKKASTSTPGAA
jgi:type I restriction enzyme R subunit